MPDDDDRSPRRRWLTENFPVFSTQVLEGNSWHPLGEAERAPEVACLTLAAFIRERAPGLPASQDQVNTAIRRLKDGAIEVTIGSHPHRIMRTDVFIDAPQQEEGLRM